MIVMGQKANVFLRDSACEQSPGRIRSVRFFRICLGKDGLAI
jgi:hypothetical protein